MAEPNSKFPKSQASQVKSDFNISLKSPIVKFGLDPSPVFTSAFSPRDFKAFSGCNQTEQIRRSICPGGISFQSRTLQQLLKTGIITTEGFATAAKPYCEFFP